MTQTAQNNGIDRLADEGAMAAFAVDESNRVTVWNRRAEELLGRTSQEVLGREIREILEARDLQGNLICLSCCGVREMARRGEPIRPFIVKLRDAKDKLAKLLMLIEAVPGPDSSKCQLVFRLSPDRREEASAPRSESLIKNGRVLSYPRTGANGAATANGLTPRQREVLWLLADGQSTAQIAQQLSISVNTVRNHEQNILRRMGTHTQAGAVAAALRQHLI